MTDRSSLSKPDEAVVKHLDWTIDVDFEGSKLHGEATYTVQLLRPGVKYLNLDTANLVVSSCKTFDGAALKYKLHPLVRGKPHLGRRLEIEIPKSSSSNDDDQLLRISVVYHTTIESSALQWLPPAQTAGKKYPYLFTQCQAIHARSLVPCQDQCGVKMTYRCTCTVPNWATSVMSALLESKTTSTSAKDVNIVMSVYTWNQPVPISSYLLAVAVGEIVKRDISDRCAIWSEPSVIDAAADEFAETEIFLKTAEDIAGMKYVWKRYDLLCLPPSFPYGGMENPCLTFVTPTLLAGDRSLADVVAHEIAHSWTGNLVTNRTWDDFWLNEGWTTWFQRKIMARVKKNPKFLDFDAIGRRKDMQDTIDELSPKDTTLVLDIGDDDPDDSYSVLSYEKGFTLLLYLERMVGTHEFEAFFKAYVARFAYQTLTTKDFKDFFLDIFEDNDKVKYVDWDAWFYSTGLPPVLPPLDQSMAKDSTALADLWMSVDRDGKARPASNAMKSWSSLQIATFLDALLIATDNQPLQLPTLQAMNQLYGLADSRNSEILFRYCDLAIAAEDVSILPVAVRFITTQGRMKFVRPLYKALYKSEMGKELAVTTFLDHKDFYHPIATKMIATDLSVGSKKSFMPSSWILGGIAIAAAGIGLALLKGKKIRL